tara:strand:+ start:1321 stop:1875 length:555 start_codon:yes stop_codon:yes gene_type:complete
MDSTIKSVASRFGLIIASVGIFYTLMAYLIDLKLMVNTMAGIGLWVVNMILLIVAVSQVKKAFGGYLSFKEAFSTFILTYSITALVSAVFGILLFSVIDPEAAERVQVLIIETTVQLMERFGAPESSITEQVEKLEATNQFSVVNQVKGFFSGIVLYAVIGLIVAAIMKRNKPEYIDQIQDTEE